jgi:hypothetical protein
MPLTYDQALSVARAEVPDDCALVPAATRVLPYGWYFAFQSKRYLLTGNWLDMKIGPGGFVVNREDGGVCHFGSAYSTDRWLEMYEYGLRYDAYDLTVLHVIRMKRAVELTLQLGLTFTVEEHEHGRRWRIPQPYTREDLQRLFDEVPVTFRNCALWSRYEVLRRIDASKCMEYRLNEAAQRHAREDGSESA